MTTDMPTTPPLGALASGEEALPAQQEYGAVRWDYGVVFVTLHVLALCALLPWFWSWAGLIAFLVGVVIFGQMAIPIGYHRLLSHRSFRSPKWFERTLVTLAMCTARRRLPTGSPGTACITRIPTVTRIRTRRGGACFGRMSVGLSTRTARG